MSDEKAGLGLAFRYRRPYVTCSDISDLWRRKDQPSTGVASDQELLRAC